MDKGYWEKVRAQAKNIVILKKDSPEIMQEVADSDALLVGFGIKTDKAVIDAAPKLRYIGSLSTAVDHIDSKYAKSKGIRVTNLPGYSTECVAEFVIAAILESIRELEKAKVQARSGDFSFNKLGASEIKGKVFGVFGAGSIGSRVAEIAMGFGADVRYWSRNRKPGLESKGAKYGDPQSLIGQCDMISLNLSLTKDTKNFLDEAAIMKIKAGAIIVNSAPMELMDTDALEKRLAMGDITFVSDHADIMPEEQIRSLSRYRNCILYPPIGFISREARIAKQEMFIGNIEGFLKGSPQNTVG